MDQHSLHLQTQGNSSSSHYPLRSEWIRKGQNLRAYSQFFYCQRKKCWYPTITDDSMCTTGPIKQKVPLIAIGKNCFAPAI